MITAELLRQAIPRAGSKAEEFAEHLEAARRKFVGDNWHHISMWLAQIAHESGSLAYVRELSSGEAYEGRKDLGNLQPGDGPRFRGRGLLQVTGRYNYAACGQALGLPLVEQPELLELPEHAAMSAGWVWKSHGLAQLCDEPDPVLACTRRLNGGTNGLEDRRQRYQIALTAIKLHSSEPSLSQPAGTTPPVFPSSETQPGPAPAAQPREASTMSPFIIAAIPTLIKWAGAAAPSLIRMFGSDGSRVAERNARAVEAVVHAAMAVTGEGTVEGATNKLNSDPAMQAKYQALLLDDLDRIMGIVAKGEELDETSRDKAAARAKGEAWDALPYLVDRTERMMTMALAMLGVALVAAFYFQVGDAYIGAIAALFVSTLTSIVQEWRRPREYRMGSSSGSKASGDAVRSALEHSTRR